MKNQIIIHSSGQQTRVALLENGELAQLFIESEENQRTVGDIYYARVHKVKSGIRAAFIDVGMEKDAFLHFSDAGDHLGSYITVLHGKNSLSPSVCAEHKSFHKFSNENKQTFARKMLNNNHKLLVKLVTEPIGTKGRRVSTDITIGGRFLVLIPMREYIAVTHKITTSKGRRRLKCTGGDMLPNGFGESS